MTKQELNYLITEYRSIESIERRIQKLRETLERTTQALSGMPHGSDGADKMASMTADIVDLMTKLDLRRIRCEVGMQKVDDAFDKLPDQQRRVMRLRYIDGMSWNRIKKVTHYEIAHLMRIQAAALERLK